MASNQDNLDSYLDRTLSRLDFQIILIILIKLIGFFQRLCVICGHNFSSFCLKLNSDNSFCTNFPFIFKFTLNVKFITAKLGIKPRKFLKFDIYLDRNFEKTGYLD